MLFLVGPARSDGRLKIGDQIAAIDGIELTKMTYLKARDVLKARPNGPVVLTVYKKLD